MRALVTGAAGFIGSHLTDALLADGHDVVAVDALRDYYPRWLKERNLSARREHPRCRFIEGDLTTMDLPALLNGVDTVFHLAAQAGVRASWGCSFDAYLRDNVLATQMLLEAAKGSAVSRIVHTSSSSIYGDAERYPTPESTIPAPVSPYGVSKLAAEHLCRLYATRFGVPALSLRLFTVYGPRQRPDMAFHIFGRALLTGAPIEVFGDGAQGREFTYVGDVVRALLLAAEKGEPGAVYNIGGGSEVTLTDVIRLMERISGRRVPVRFLAAQPGDARRTAADARLSRERLVYTPAVSLEDGLRAEVDWLRELLVEETGREA